jgi:hypothetical protein
MTETEIERAMVATRIKGLEKATAEKDQVAKDAFHLAGQAWQQAAMLGREVADFEKRLKHLMARFVKQQAQLSEMEARLSSIENLLEGRPRAKADSTK